MKSPSNLLIITASNGENLLLAKKFQVIGTRLSNNTELIDLTVVDLPIFNPRNKIPEDQKRNLSKLHDQLNTFSHWVICAPEYNGSIPPILTNAIAWLSMEGQDFRTLFNGRPIALASYSGGNCMSLLISLRIQLSHLGAQVLGRQLTSNKEKEGSDKSIKEIVNLLLQMEPLRPQE